jgi:pimeloyl-ACP methyl ester carboxylesterase
MKIILKVLLGLLVVLLLAAAGFTAWGLTPSAPMPEATAALQSDGLVTVKTGDLLEFTPASGSPQTGFIFYPGGHVDYRAYAPLARALAGRGFVVIIPRMPLNLAVLAPAKAGEIIRSNPAIRNWAVGGHSLGGAMAANYLKTNPGTAKGLIFLAAYPASSDDLTQSGLKVLSISASLDGLATPAKIDASRSLLPADTIWLEITGGDHAQFGWYGPQAGDNPAEIGREAQQTQVIESIATFLKSLEGTK